VALWIDSRVALPQQVENAHVARVFWIMTGHTGSLGAEISNLKMARRDGSIAGGSVPNR
jgi:hypothetical protein